MLIHEALLELENLPFLLGVPKSWFEIQNWWKSATSTKVMNDCPSIPEASRFWLSISKPRRR